MVVGALMLGACPAEAQFLGHNTPGDFGLQSMDWGWITGRQIEAGRLLLFWLPGNSHFPFLTHGTNPPIWLG